MSRAVSLTVSAAVTRDLAELARIDEDLAAGSLAATALALAAEIDKPGNSATSKSMCAKALNETMAVLRALVPRSEANDRLDELAGRREQRRGVA